MAVEVIPLTTVGVIVIISLFGGLFFKKMRQNEVIGFILAGFLLGPFFLNFLHPEDALIGGFSQLGLFFLLFYLGIELSWKEFISAGSAVFGLAIIDLLLIMGISFSVMLMLGYSLFFSLAVAAMLGNTSTAIVAKFIFDRNLGQSNGARVSLSINVLQDFLGIMLLVFLSSIASTTKKGFNTWEIVGTAITALVFAVSAFYAVNYLSKIVERWMKDEGFGFNKLTLYALGVVLIVATLGQMLGLSESLGAYFGGFALSETKSGKKIKKDLVFIMDFFLVFFFVAFGTTIMYDPALQKVVLPTLGDFVMTSGLALLLSFIVIFGHSFSTRVFGTLFGLSAEDATVSAILLFPLGEFLVVIATAVAGILVGAEARIVSLLGFLLILITLVMFQPAFELQGLHQKIMSYIPRLPEPRKNTVIKPHTTYTLQQAKDMALNLFIVLCLAWVAVVIYLTLPDFGVPIKYSREITAFAAFLFFASYPFYRALRAFKRIVRQTAYGAL
ncbi:MAG: cation:proton antiporter [Candidatus Diapherotrites archaeon]|nr:cation:proton antiporter [Candidatus Diapherotrites archaeon]